MGNPCNCKKALSLGKCNTYYIQIYPISEGYLRKIPVNGLLFLKSTCDVNLLSKLSIIFKEWRVIVLCTFKVPQEANNLILCTLDTIHRFFLFQD
jgi:hypothetical protein